jgi:hypothetical protein
MGSGWSEIRHPPGFDSRGVVAMAPILTHCRLVTPERRTGVDLACLRRPIGQRLATPIALFMPVEIYSSRPRERAAQQWH